MWTIPLGGGGGGGGQFFYKDTEEDSKTNTKQNKLLCQSKVRYTISNNLFQAGFKQETIYKSPHKNFLAHVIAMNR